MLKVEQNQITLILSPYRRNSEICTMAVQINVEISTVDYHASNLLNSYVLCE